MTTRIDSTPRGFGIYANFEDTRGATVRVQESSQADDFYLWIFSYGGELAGTGESPDVPTHLNVAQAIELRDGINRWLEEIQQYEQESDGSI